MVHKTGRLYKYGDARADIGAGFPSRDRDSASYGKENEKPSDTESELSSRRKKKQKKLNTIKKKNR